MALTRLQKERFDREKLEALRTENAELKRERDEVLKKGVAYCNAASDLKSELVDAQERIATLEAALREVENKVNQDLVYTHPGTFSDWVRAHIKTALGGKN